MLCLYYIISSGVLHKRIQQHPICDWKTEVLKKTSHMHPFLYYALFLSRIIPSYPLLKYFKTAYKTMSLITYIVLIWPLLQHSPFSYSCYRLLFPILPSCHMYFIILFFSPSPSLPYLFRSSLLKSFLSQLFVVVAIFFPTWHKLEFLGRGKSGKPVEYFLDKLIQKGQLSVSGATPGSWSG